MYLNVQYMFAIHKSLFTIVATFGLFFLLMDLYVVGYPGYYGHLMVFMRGGSWLDGFVSDEGHCPGQKNGASAEIPKTAVCLMDA